MDAPHPVSDADCSTTFSMLMLTIAVTFMSTTIIVSSMVVLTIVALFASGAAYSPEASTPSNHGEQQ